MAYEFLNQSFNEMMGKDFSDCFAVFEVFNIPNDVKKVLLLL